MNFFSLTVPPVKSNSAGTLKISLFLSSHRFQEKDGSPYEDRRQDKLQDEAKEDPVIRDQIPSLTSEKVPDLKVSSASRNLAFQDLRERDRRIREQQIDGRPGSRLRDRLPRPQHHHIDLCLRDPQQEHIQHVRPHHEDQHDPVGDDIRKCRALHQRRSKDSETSAVQCNGHIAEQQQEEILRTDAPIDEGQHQDRKTREHEDHQMRERRREFSDHNVDRADLCRKHQLQRVAFPLPADAGRRQRRHDEHQHHKLQGSHKRVEL